MTGSQPHDETTCKVCVSWAQSNVLMLENIGELEKLWLKRNPDDHIYSGATDERRAFWRTSFTRTSEVIRHVLAARSRGEDALAWHERVLRAACADDPVAMNNVEAAEARRDKSARGIPNMLYDDGIEADGIPEGAGRNSLLVQWLHVLGLEWAQGTRFPANLPDELKLHPPGFMRKLPRRGRSSVPPPQGARGGRVPLLGAMRRVDILSRRWHDDDPSEYVDLPTDCPHDQDCPACDDLRIATGPMWERGYNGKRYVNRDWRGDEANEVGSAFPHRFRALLDHRRLVLRSKSAWAASARHDAAQVES